MGRWWTRLPRHAIAELAMLAMLCGGASAQERYSHSPPSVQLDTSDSPIALDGLSFAGGLVATLSGRGVGPRGEIGARFTLARPFSERVDLDLRLAAGIAYTEWGSRPLVPGGYPLSLSWMWLDLVAHGELVVAVTERFHVFGLVGLGGSWGFTTTDEPFIGPQTVDAGAFVLQFRAGIRLELSDAIALEAQPLGFTGNIASSVGWHFTLLAGISVEP